MWWSGLKGFLTQIIGPGVLVSTCVVEWIERFCVMSRISEISVSTCVVEWIERQKSPQPSLSLLVSTCVVEWIERIHKTPHIRKCVGLHLCGGVD